MCLPPCRPESMSVSSFLATSSSTAVPLFLEARCQKCGHLQHAGQGMFTFKEGGQLVQLVLCIHGIERPLYYR